MLENMALVSLPDTENVGLCGKASFWYIERCGCVLCSLHSLSILCPQVICFLRVGESGLFEGYFIVQMEKC